MRQTQSSGRGFFTAKGSIIFHRKDLRQVVVPGSALPHTPHELESASHPYELQPVHSTVVRIVQKQMGIAGDDSWGAQTHEEFLLDIRSPMEFTFSFKGI